MTAPGINLLLWDDYRPWLNASVNPYRSLPPPPGSGVTWPEIRSRARAAYTFITRITQP